MNKPVIQRGKTPITAYEIDELVRLRILAVPYHDIATRLGRSYAYWQKAVDKYQVGRFIDIKRSSLIEDDKHESEDTHQPTRYTSKSEERHTGAVYNGQNIQVQPILL